MQSGYTSQKLIKEYSSGTEQDIKDRILNALDQSADHFFQKLTATVGIAEKGTLEEVIKSLEAFRQAPHLTGWDEVIEEETKGLPELVLLPQQEQHYRTQEDDSLTVKSGKAAKRIQRGARKTGIMFVNGIRTVLKKKKIQWEYPLREVPFRGMVISELMALSHPVKAFESLDLRMHALVFEKVYRWCVHTSDEESGKYDRELTEILNEIGADYEKSLSEVKDLVEQQFLTISEQLKVISGKAGTVELPPSSYSAESVQNRVESFKRGIGDLRKAWQFLIGQLSERSVVLGSTVLFKSSLQEKEEQITTKIGEGLTEIEETSHSRLKALISTAVEELTPEKALTLKELNELGGRISASASEFIHEQLIQPLQDAIDARRLSSSIEQYLEQLLFLPTRLEEEIILLEHLDLTGELPDYDVREVGWQRIIRRMLTEYVVNELNVEKLDPEDTLEKMIECYKEAEQIILANLDMVDEVTKDEDHKPVEVAVQGMERALMKVEEAGEILNSTREELTSRFEEQNKALVSELIGFLNKDDFGDVKWIETQLKVRESAGGWKDKWTVLWATTLGKKDLFVRFAKLKYRLWFGKIQQFLGRDTSGKLSSEKINLATFLYETDQKFKDLPFTYRRLFDFTREIDMNFYINDPVHFESARKAYELWKDGFPSSLVVVGEKGSGKTTLYRFLADETFTDKQYVLTLNKTIWEEKAMLKLLADALSLKEVTDSESLITKVRKNRKGSVVVVENLQNGFVRAMKGYAGIKILMSVVAETKEEVFWVVSGSRYAWNFLQVYLRIGDHFSHTLVTDELNAEEIKELIMKRHKASGFQLRFVPEAETENSRAYKKYLENEAEQQKYLREEYFSRLTKIAEGNATVAIIYWVRSIIEFGENEVLVKNMDISGAELLSNLDPASLFTLSSFVLHDALTPDELALSLHIPESEADMMISRLNTSGLLVNKKEYYSLNQLIYRQVVRVLKNKNILH